eukprot:5227340-Pleurochrysis_carterae.AAC.6
MKDTAHREARIIARAGLDPLTTMRLKVLRRCIRRGSPSTYNHASAVYCRALPLIVASGRDDYGLAYYECSVRGKEAC